MGFNTYLSPHWEAMILYFGQWAWFIVGYEWVGAPQLPVPDTRIPGVDDVPACQRGELPVATVG